MILEETVLITLGNRNIPYFQELGYVMPTIKRKGKMVVPRGTQIEVKVEHLTDGCGVLLTKICDYCGDESKQPYRAIIRYRDINEKDCCANCGGTKILEVFKNKPIPKGRSLAEKYPPLSLEWHPSLNDTLPHEVYATSSSKYWWICPQNEEHIYDAAISSRSYNRGCPFCSGRKVNHTNCLATTHPELISEWDTDKNGQITPYNITSGSGRYAYWKCSANGCNNTWRTKVQNRCRSNGCPKCKESKGEKSVRNFLDQNNFNFLPQYTFDNLIGTGGGLLKFDFAVFDTQKSLNYLIEYDGIFHFERQYDDDGYKTLIIHDQLKNNYCKKNNIRLIRIPYWEYENVDIILNRELIKPS